ncbi:hypothetical protein [Halobacillus karajensis]|nr:hypothetical protein [Halobacillus karajensis]
MKARKVKRQVQFNQPFKGSDHPMVINTSSSGKGNRPIRRGGCCGKKRT